MIVFTSPHLCQKWAKSAVTLAIKCLTDWCWKNQWICEWHTTRKKTCQEKETHVHRSSLTTEHHAIDPKCVQATRVSGQIYWLHTFIYFVKYIWNSNWTAVVDESEEEVMGSNPVEALIFFRLLPSICLNWKIYCDDHSSLSPFIFTLFCIFRVFLMPVWVYWKTVNPAVYCQDYNNPTSSKYLI